MKSAMPYLGITTPELRAASRRVFTSAPIDERERWEATVLSLFRGATYREERYAAIELLRFAPYARWVDTKLLRVLEELIVTGAWWDFVDTIAINLVGALLEGHPKTMATMLRRWAHDANIWKRRSAILAQLKFKAATDEKLLVDCIEPSLGETEFFLRKSIGWALREYSKTNPAFVIDYVDAKSGELSNLSKREALKVLQKKGTVARPP